MFPSRGLSTNLDFKVSAPMGDLRLYKVDYDFSWFMPVYDPFVFNLKLDLGFADAYNKKPFPFYKHYYLGGGDSVRGYEDRSLGPKSSNGDPFGGNFVTQGRAQLIFPPPFFKDAKNVRTSLFLDGGQVYDTQNKKDARGFSRNPKGFRYSAGFGMFMNIPALNVPVALSFAWPLNKKLGDTERRFAFSLGTQF